MRAALAAAGVAALLLAACGGGGGSGTLPSLPSTQATSTEAGTTTDAVTASEAATTTEAPPASTVTLTEATTTTTPAPDPVADKRLARTGLVMRGDLPSGLGFKGVSPPGAPSRCFTAPARKLRPAGSGTGRQFIGNRSRSLVTSLAWSFRDEDTASEALAAVGDAAAVECFGKANARGANPPLKYLGATKLDFPTVGDETDAYRAEFRLQGTSVAADYVFVRTGRVVTAAAFQNTGSPPKQSTTQAVLEQVAARVGETG